MKRSLFTLAALAAAFAFRESRVGRFAVATREDEIAAAAIGVNPFGARWIAWIVSIAVVDSDTFKGVREVESLERRTQEQLDRYVRFARTLGLPARGDYAVGTEVAVEAEELGRRMLDRYPRALVVAGQLIFEEDTAWTRTLHNETAFLIQRRLQHAGVPMIVLPVRLNLRATRRNLPVVPRVSLTAPPPVPDAPAEPE